MHLYIEMAARDTPKRALRLAGHGDEEFHNVLPSRPIESHYEAVQILKDIQALRLVE
jgi:hypothetical protein